MVYIPPTLPLTERITIAWRGLKAARISGDPTAEFGFSQLLDRLLDRYIDGER